MTFDNQIATIKKQRKMLNFQRLAGTRKIRSYNLAEHSYFVGLMFQDFANSFGIEYTIETLDVVFRHDFMEVFTTDLPYPVKNQNDKTKTAWNIIEEQAMHSLPAIGILGLYTDKDMKTYLNPEQLCLLKWCDMLELVLFCLEERAMGNNGGDISNVLENCENALNSEYFINSYEWNKSMIEYYEKFLTDLNI